MSKLLILLFLLLLFSLNLYGVKWDSKDIVYSVNAKYINNLEKTSVKNVFHKKDKKNHIIGINLIDNKQINNITDIYIYIDKNFNGLYDKCLQYNLKNGNSFLTNLDDKDDWSKWTQISGLKINKENGLEIEFSEDNFSEDFTKDYLVKIDLKIFKTKELWASSGFWLNDNLRNEIDGNLKEWKDENIVLKRNINLKTNKSKAKKVYFLESEDYIKVGIDLDKNVNDKLDSINLKFFKPYEKKQHHSIYINCVKNEYWIFDEKENKWYYSCFPFSYNDGIEFYIPKKIVNYDISENIYVSYGVTEGDNKYYKRIFLSNNILNFNKISGNNLDFTEKDKIYKNTDIKVTNKDEYIDKMYLSFKDGIYHLAIKTNSLNYDFLKEVGIYFDRNGNSKPEDAIRILVDDDLFYYNNLKDNYDWNTGDEIFWGNYTENEYFEVIFWYPDFSIKDANIRVQLHYDKKEDNFVQIRLNNKKDLPKTLDGDLSDWNSSENVIFKTISSISEKTYSPTKCFINFSKNYTVFGVENSIKDYTNLETVRFLFDTNFDGNWNYAIDFSCWNGEAHIYYLSDTNDWKGRAIHDIDSGFSLKNGIEAYIPNNIIDFNANNAFIDINLIYKDNKDYQFYGTAGKTYSKKLSIEIDGKNNGEWNESDLLSKDHIYDNVKQNDINVKNLYCKKIDNYYAFAFDFVTSINDSITRITTNIDTDYDGKLNYFLAFDMVSGLCYIYNPDNKDNYKTFKLASDALCGVEKDFIEILLPQKFFTEAKPEITFGVEYKIKDELKYDYVFASFYPEKEKNILQTLKQSEYTTLIKNGDSSNKVDIVILSDGYTNQEKEKFIDTATKSMNAFLQNKTFKLFQNDFNFYYKFIPSKDSGAYDVKKGVKFPDTVFKAGLWQEGFYTSKDKANIYYALQNLPDYEVIWVISNNDNNGAGTGGFVNGMGGLSVSGSLGIETPIHETGHALFGLADEYENEFYAKTLSLPPTKENFKNIINVTVLDEIDFSTFETFKKTLKWGWVYDYPDLKNITSLYEGAHYLPKDRFRPEFSCIMRAGDSGKTYSRFCVVCIDAIAKKMYELTGKTYNRKEFFINPDIFTAYDKMRIKYKGETKKLKIISAKNSYNNSSPEKVIDDDFYSMWEAYPLPAEIIFDIGESINIGGIFISLFQTEKNEFIYKYKISISKDNKNYIDVNVKDNETFAPQKGYYIDVNKESRFIRITSNYGEPNKAFYIRDFILFSNDLKNDQILDYEILKGRKRK